MHRNLFSCHCVRLAPVFALVKALHALVVRRRREHVQAVPPQVLHLDQLPPPPEAATLVCVLLLGLPRGGRPLARDAPGSGVDLHAGQERG